MTVAAARAVKVDGPERLSVLCVPYNQPALVGIATPSGQPILFREMFSVDSWASLPQRVPLNDGHDPERPLGWVRLHSASDGLHGDVELIESSGARDALAQVKAALRLGVSIGFRDNPKADIWSRPQGSRQLPQVLRRGADLEEVSLVSRAAYSSARVLAVTRDSWEAQESRRLMGDYPVQRQREQEQQRQQQRAADRELLANLDRMASVRWDDPTGEALSSPVSHAIPAQAPSHQAPPADGAMAVRIGLRRYLVRGATSPEQACRIAQQAVQLERFLPGAYPPGAYMDHYGVQRLDD